MLGLHSAFTSKEVARLARPCPLTKNSSSGGVGRMKPGTGFVDRKECPHLRESYKYQKSWRKKRRFKLHSAPVKWELGKRTSKEIIFTSSRASPMSAPSSLPVMIWLHFEKTILNRVFTPLNKPLKVQAFRHTVLILCRFFCLYFLSAFLGGGDRMWEKEQFSDL